MRLSAPNRISCNMRNWLWNRKDWPTKMGNRKIRWSKNLQWHFQSWILGISFGIQNIQSFRPWVWKTTQRLYLIWCSWLKWWKMYMSLWKTTSPKWSEQPKGKSRVLESVGNNKLNLEKTQDYQSTKKPNIQTQSRGRIRRLNQCRQGCIQRAKILT